MSDPFVIVAVMGDPGFRAHAELERELWPTSATDCGGMLRVIDTHARGALAMCRCDQCGFVVDVKVPVVPAEPDAQEEMAF